ncbi:MAG: tellurite resistance TerB family protein [Acetobacteraceae bacterium]|jgi:tellurite resistance protein|nr:tellurite resistance TerB family protein [Acetobacteraceae bacterium]
MSGTDFGRILGALLGGAQRGGLRPARRRRRAPAPLFDVRVGGSRTAARALATLAGAVLGTVLSGGQTQAPSAPPRQTPRSSPRPIDVASAPPPPPGPVGKPLPNPWASPAPKSPPPAPENEATGAEDEEALLILRAMISCAKADGTLDAAERAAISDQLDQAGLDQAARDLVLAEFARPASVAEIGAAVSDPVLAAQVYAAAFLAAGEVTAAERAWLEAFARAAGLDPRAAAEIERRLTED